MGIMDAAAIILQLSVILLLKYRDTNTSMQIRNRLIAIKIRAKILNPRRCEVRISHSTIRINTYNEVRIGIPSLVPHPIFELIRSNSKSKTAFEIKLPRTSIKGLLRRSVKKLMLASMDKEATKVYFDQVILLLSILLITRVTRIPEINMIADISQNNFRF
jgi:hypothetical protein